MCVGGRGEDSMGLQKNGITKSSPRIAQRDSKQTHTPGPLPNEASRAITELLRGDQVSEPPTNQSQRCSGLSPVASCLGVHCVS